MGEALLVFAVLGPLVGGINFDVTVLVYWIDTQDIVVRSLGEILGNNSSHFESVSVSLGRGIPNYLRVKDDAVSVKDINITTLTVFRSALLKTQAMRWLTHQ